VTGRLGTAFGVEWSQGELRLPRTLGGRTDVELATARVSFGLAATRGTALSVEVAGQRAAYPVDSADVALFWGRLVLDHETLDRIDFPRSGADVRARLEWGLSDVTTGGHYTVSTVDARVYVPLHSRLTADLGAWVGHQRGPDLPAHRRFLLGGAHPSAVFSGTHPLFHGLPPQEHAGTDVQVARLGLRWRVTGNGYLRAGVDVGRAVDAWELPVERPMTGWSLSGGASTIVGPVELEVAKVWSGRWDPRVSVSVGRGF
jgi:hypothetical protein